MGSPVQLPSLGRLANQHQIGLNDRLQTRPGRVVSRFQTQYLPVPYQSVVPFRRRKPSGFDVACGRLQQRGYLRLPLHSLGALHLCRQVFSVLDDSSVAAGRAFLPCQSRHADLCFTPFNTGWYLGCRIGLHQSPRRRAPQRRPSDLGLHAEFGHDVVTRRFIPYPP